MDAAFLFSRFIFETNYNDLPADVIEVAKKSVLDTLGAGMQGSIYPEIKEIYELIQRWGGREESTVLAFGGRFPCHEAAFINAAMCHVPESDDTFWEAGLHPGCVVVPAALAIAESTGGLDGRKFLAAVCVATEMACRIGKATKYRRPEMVMSGWDNSALLGFFEAAACGKLLGLNEEQILNALGLAYAQSAGNEQCIRDGTLAKKIGPAFAARGGVTAAFMAEKGITGARNIFEEGISSYYKVYHAGYDKATLTGNLGKDYLMLGVDLKPHNCCIFTFASIDGTLKLVKEHHIQADEIQEIIIRTHPHAEVCCYPEDIKKRPRSTMDAQFSIPWLVACAVVKGKANRREVAEESLRDGAVLKVAAKVQTILDPAFRSPEHHNIRIKTTRGEFETTILHPYGTTDNPMSFTDVAQKFLTSAADSVKPIPDKNKAQVIELVKSLETLKDVTSLMKLLV